MRRTTSEKLEIIRLVEGSDDDGDVAAAAAFSFSITAVKYSLLACLACSRAATNGAIGDVVVPRRGSKTP